MKTKVEVEVVARKTVVIVVDHNEDEDPTDLTPQDMDNAKMAYELGQEPEFDYEDPKDLGPL